MRLASRLCLLSWALAGAHACTPKDAAPTPSKRAAPATFKAEGRRVAKTLQYVAAVIAPRDATLSSTRGGRVEAYLTDLGKPVRSGEVLVKLGASELQFASQAALAGVAQMTARTGGVSDPAQLPGVVLEQARLDAALDAARRAERLHTQGSMSEQELTRSRTNAVVARAQFETALASAKADLGRLREMQAMAGQAQAAINTDKEIRAPFAGVVLERFVEFGQMASANAPLVRVVDPNELYVRFDVPQFEAAQAVLGRAVSVRLGGQTLSAQVIRLTPGLVGEANARRVEARLARTPDDPADLLPGARVPVWLETGEQENIVALPRAAASQVAGVWRAWVVQQGRLSERLLAVARVAGQDDLLLVRSGLQAGEDVVTTPQADFRAGEEIAP